MPPFPEKTLRQGRNSWILIPWHIRSAKMPEEQPPKTHVQSGGESSSSGSSGSTPTKKKVTIVEPDDNNNANNNNNHNNNNNNNALLKTDAPNKVKISLKTSKVKSGGENGDKSAADEIEKKLPTPIYKVSQ